MQITIISIGNKMPAWVNEGFFEYQKRFGKDVRLELIELELPKHAKNVSAEKRKLVEAGKIEKVLDRQSRIIVLDVLGKQFSTEKLSGLLESWLAGGKPISMVVGGPDGLDDSIIRQAETVWSLSQLTFPHTIIRIMLAEQLYRAWSILQHHPYHRA